jgi:hypothetical protein
MNVFNEVIKSEVCKNYTDQQRPVFFMKPYKIRGCKGYNSIQICFFELLFQRKYIDVVVM